MTQIRAAAVGVIQVAALDAGIAMTSLILAAEAYGLGCCPISAIRNEAAKISDLLGLPTIWVPHSYAACFQHAPNEHILEAVTREALQLMTGLFWDLGETPPNWKRAA